MSVPSGNSLICFPVSLNVSLDFASGHIESLGKTKLTISLAEHYVYNIITSGLLHVIQFYYHQSSKLSYA